MEKKKKSDDIWLSFYQKIFKAKMWVIHEVFLDFKIIFGGSSYIFSLQCSFEISNYNKLFEIPYFLDGSVLRLTQPMYFCYDSVNIFLI